MKDTVEEMKDYFWFCGGFKGRTHSMNVSTKTRKQFLIDNPSNRVTVDCGMVLDVQWKNLGGVFDKYAAVIEYMDGAGFGESYGGASFYRLTATDPVNGNVETKDIVSASLTSDKLV